MTSVCWAWPAVCAAAITSSKESWLSREDPWITITTRSITWLGTSRGRLRSKGISRPKPSTSTGKRHGLTLLTGTPRAAGAQGRRASAAKTMRGNRAARGLRLPARMLRGGAGFRARPRLGCRTTSGIPRPRPERAARTRRNAVTVRTLGAILYEGFELLDVYGPLEMFGSLGP